MFFLIKCAFWLTIVFSCMTWPDNEGPGAVARQAVAGAAEHAQQVVVEKASAACTADPRKCLATVQRAAEATQALSRPARPTKTQTN